MEPRTIDRLELKAKLERGDDFKLVMALNDWAFNAFHIPGSINIESAEDAVEILNKDDEIVVYCSSAECTSSQVLYQKHVALGFTNVRRYPGGLEEWLESGLQLDGDDVAWLEKTQAKGTGDRTASSG